MHDTLTYQIGPALTAMPNGERARDWFAISGPAQQQSSALAARIAFLERKLAALESRHAWQAERLSGFAA